MHPNTRDRKTAPANKINYTLIWYTFYNFWPGNGAGPVPIFTVPEPTWAYTSMTHAMMMMLI